MIEIWMSSKPIIENKFWFILHPQFYNEILSWMIEIKVGNHLVSDKNCNIVNL